MAFLQNINGPEILIIFLIVLLLFGAKRLPELFRSFGKSLKEFKKATSDIEDEVRSAMDVEDDGTSRKEGTARKESRPEDGARSERTARETPDESESREEKRDKRSGDAT